MNLDNIFEIIVILLLILIILCIVIRVRKLSNINEVSENFENIIENLSGTFNVTTDLNNQTSDESTYSLGNTNTSSIQNSSSINDLKKEVSDLQTEIQIMKNTQNTRNNSVEAHKEKQKNEIVELKKKVNSNTEYIKTIKAGVKEFQDHIKN